MSNKKEWLGHNCAICMRKDSTPLLAKGACEGWQGDAFEGNQHGLFVCHKHSQRCGNILLCSDCKPLSEVAAVMAAVMAAVIAPKQISIFELMDSGVEHPTLER